MSMRQRGTIPNYRPSVRPSWRTNRGPRVYDAIDGNCRYRDEMVVNDDGQLVYALNRRTYDRRYDLEGDSDYGTM